MIQITPYPIDNLRCIIKSSMLWIVLPMSTNVKKLVSDFFTSFPQKTYLKNSVFIMPNTPINTVFYIEKGMGRVYIISSKGNEVTINFFSKGSFIPVALVINKQDSAYYYEAFTDLHVRVAPAQKVLQFLKNNPIVVYDLLQRVYRGIEGILLHKEYLVDGNAGSKLAYSLIILARRFGEFQKNQQTLIPMELDETRIASYAGLARETVSRELRKLQEKNIISYERKQITINNLCMLESIIESAIDTF